MCTPAYLYLEVNDLTAATTTTKKKDPQVWKVEHLDEKSRTVRFKDQAKQIIPRHVFFPYLYDLNNTRIITTFSLLSAILKPRAMVHGLK